jgi:hypothetical protein
MAKKDAPRYWQPLVVLRPDEMYRRPEIIQETMQHYGIDETAAKARLDAEDAKSMYLVNDIYQVQVSKHRVEWFGQGPKDMLQICVRRRDGGMIWDWRHFQQIKNEIAGPECEGIQLCPSENRKVDTSNKWHIWVLMDGTIFPFGWTKRDVQDDIHKGVPGLRQRAL